MALSSSVCVRRYLSEPGEKEALRVLKEQLRHQKRITSDDVRLAVRTVASQGGAVSIPAGGGCGSTKTTRYLGGLGTKAVDAL